MVPPSDFELPDYESRRCRKGGLEAVIENISRLGVLLQRNAQGRSLRQRLTDSLSALAPQPGAAKPRALVVFSSEGEPVRQALGCGSRRLAR